MKSFFIKLATAAICTTSIILFVVDWNFEHQCATKGEMPLLTGGKIKCEVVKP